MIIGRFPLVMPNWENVSATGRNPVLAKPVQVLIMFASATPISKERPGTAFWNAATPVDPARSALTETTGRPSCAAVVIARANPAWTFSFFAAGDAAGEFFLVACFSSHALRNDCAQEARSAGVLPPVISLTNSTIFSPSLSGKP